MEFLKQEITLDVVPSKEKPIVYADQFDHLGRVIRLNLVQNGEPYTLPDAVSCQISGIKPSTTVFDYDGRELDRNICTKGITYVEFPIQEQMVTVAGKVLCGLTIWWEETRIGTLNFIIDVQQGSLAPDGIADASDFGSILNDYVEAWLEENRDDIEQYVTRAETSAETAESASSSAQASAEIASRSAQSASQSATSANSSAQSASQSAQSASQSASSASQSAQAAKQSQDAAKESELNAKQSEEDAEDAADRAEQAAGKAGFMFMDIDEHGHLIYRRTDQVDADFHIERPIGHLILEAL